MSDTVYLKVDDLEPSLELTLTDEATSAGVDLSNAEEVLLTMTARDGTVVIDERPIDVTAAENGEVSMDWESGDTATAGIYAVTAKVIWPGDRPQTFPAKGNVTVYIDQA